MAAAPQNPTIDDIQNLSSDDNDIESAAEAAQADDPAQQTRTWLLEVHSGTLCTLAAKRELEGFPFGSIVPFALDASGAPIVYIAKIAAHTANLRRDPRATLFVHQPGVEGDPQKGWRVGVSGRMSRLVEEGDEVDAKETIERVSASELEDIHARYVERVPWAADYSKTHSFQYWRMSRVERVRYIAGFGKICWVDGDDVIRQPHGNGFEHAVPGAIEHMNEDHAENMREMCTGLYGFTPDAAHMERMDRTGFLVRTQGPDRLVHFSYGRELQTPDEIRVAVVDVLKRARAAQTGGAA